MDIAHRLSVLFRRTGLPAALEYVTARPRVAIGVVALAALLECVAFAALRAPVAYIPDEFANLLAAETYASGRLTNPPHPLREYLESMSIIQEPTYQSKYPPAEGLVLAAGMVFGGHALVGVWLSFALACGAAVWMMQAWLPKGSALLGGLLLVFNPIVIEYGAQYIGGAPAMLGGALLFGALRRLVDDPRPGLSIPLAAGVWLLATSRPFEGLVTTVPAAIVIAVWFIRAARTSRGAMATRLMLRTGLLLALGFGWLGYYHYRVTGSPFVMPYQVHLAKIHDNNFAWEMSTGSGVSAVATRAGESGAYLLRMLTKAKGPALAGCVALLLLLTVFGADRWSTFALVTFGLTFGAVCVTAGGQLRYLAPVVPLYFLLMARSALSLWTLLDRNALLKRARLGLTVAFLGWQGAGQFLVASSWKTNRFDSVPYWQHGWIYDRARLVAPLEQRTALQLVMVRTDPGAAPNTMSDWVYNSPNIDTQKVVWAWEKQEPGPLFDYYSTREAWVLDLHKQPLRLERAVRQAPQWTLRVNDAGMARLIPATDPEPTGVIRMEVGDGGGQPRKVQVEWRVLPVVAGLTYRVSFRGRASRGQSVGVHVSQAHGPWANLGLFQEVPLTPEWQVFTLRFTASKDDGIARLAFDVRNPGLIELSDAIVTRTDTR